MPSGDVAIILHRPGDTEFEKRQRWVCQRYAERQGYHVRTVVWSGSDALTLVKIGHAQLVIVATEDPGDGQLLRELEEAGARLEYCRPRRTRRPEQGRPSGLGGNTVEIMRRLYELGERDTDRLAALLRKPANLVHNILDSWRRRG